MASPQIAAELGDVGGAGGAVGVQVVAEALNVLLQGRRLEVVKRGEELIYRALGEGVAQKFQGLNAEDLLVYQIVKAAHNVGIWTKDLKARSNLRQPQITKILKLLEARQIVKAVKSVQNRNRKVYMLYDLEPSREITGGAWYTEHEFDAEYIQCLQETCFQFIKQATAPRRVAEVAHFLARRGVSRVELGEEDVLSVLQTLIYDGRVDEVEVGGEMCFKQCAIGLPSPGFFAQVRGFERALLDAESEHAYQQGLLAAEGDAAA